MKLDEPMWLSFVQKSCSLCSQSIDSATATLSCFAAHTRDNGRVFMAFHWMFMQFSWVFMGF